MPLISSGHDSSMGRWQSDEAMFLTFPHELERNFSPTISDPLS